MYISLITDVYSKNYGYNLDTIFEEKIIFKNFGYGY